MTDVITPEELDRLTKDVDLDRLGTFVDGLTRRVATLEETAGETLVAVTRLDNRLKAGPVQQPNGNGLFHALFRTKEGKISREKFLAFLMTAGPLVLLPFLQDIGVNQVLLNGAGIWFSTHGGSKWIARHQRDKPVDTP